MKRLLASGGSGTALASETGLRAVAVSGRPPDDPIWQRDPFVE